MANYTREISHMMDRMLTKVLKQDRKGYYQEQLIFKLSLLDVLAVKMIGEHKALDLASLIKGLELDRNLVDTSLKNLIGLKLVMKQKGKRDKREKLLVLTEQGHVLYQKLMQAQLSELEFILNDITINEEKTILKFLSKIVQYHTEKYEINE